jgi:membrane-bound metal-dependent hydrolase YbcI (DUF457 family)
MPFAVTHVLFPIILVDLYRDYIAKRNRYFTLHTVFIAGVFGLIPDIDIPVNYILNFFGLSLVHRTLTHTPIFGLIFLLPAVILWYRKKHKVALYFFAASFGIFSHIFLDYFFTADPGGIMLLYPFSYTPYALNLLQTITLDHFAAIDAVILLAWLWHEEYKHKIIDFI